MVVDENGWIIDTFVESKDSYMESYCVSKLF